MNKQAAEIFLNYDVHAATDITGFGLAGHGLEMAQGSEASIHINLDEVPVMDEAYKMYELGVSTGVNKHNRAKTMPSMHFNESAKTEKREILFDPQTSGGLLVSIPQNQANDALNDLQSSGLSDAKIIGQAKEPDPKIQIFVS